MVGAGQIAGLPGRQMKREWIAEGIGQGMNFGAQSAFAPTNRFRLSIPLFAPALC